METALITQPLMRVPWVSGSIRHDGEFQTHSLLLRDSDGSVIDWNLQVLVQMGEKLSPLNPGVMVDRFWFNTCAVARSGWQWGTPFQCI